MIALCICVVIITEGVIGLRLSKLDIPGVVMRGDAVWLNCSYDLETDKLYSIKWYKNNLEFYRYQPSDFPPGQKYELLGIYLDLLKSELGHVYLYETDLNSDGKYRCEVSADAPSFQTASEEKMMEIYVLPRHGPKFIGSYDNYRIGDDVNATCAASYSKPAAILKWYINDLEAPTRVEEKVAPLIDNSGLESSRLRLQFTAEPRHFWNGTMKLKCVALLSQVYARSSEEIIASTVEGSTGIHVAKSSEDVSITGAKQKYQIGEHVDINCTAVKSRPPAELHWFINGKKTVADYLINYPPIRYSDGEESSVLGMRFMVRPRHFKRNEMKLKCTATLSKIFNMNSKEVIFGTSLQSSGLRFLANGEKVSDCGSTMSKYFWSLVFGFVVSRL